MVPIDEHEMMLALVDMQDALRAFDLNSPYPYTKMRAALDKHQDLMHQVRNALQRKTTA